MFVEDVDDVDEVDDLGEASGEKVESAGVISYSELAVKVESEVSAELELPDRDRRLRKLSKPCRRLHRDEC